MAIKEAIGVPLIVVDGEGVDMIIFAIEEEVEVGDMPGILPMSIFCNYSALPWSRRGGRM